MRARNLWNLIIEADGFTVGTQVKFKDGTPYAGMVGQIANVHADSGNVDVMVGKSIRVDIATSDLEAVPAPGQAASATSEPEVTGDSDEGLDEADPELAAKKKAAKERRIANVAAVTAKVNAQKEKIAKMKDDHEKAMEKEHAALAQLRRDLEFRKSQHTL
jgi:hypothetical protein